MKNKFSKDIRFKFGNGNVINHTSTKNNNIGQSGIHTLVNDMVDIFESVILNDQKSQLKNILKNFFTKEGDSLTLFPILNHVATFLQTRGEFNSFIEEIEGLFEEVENDITDIMVRKIHRFFYDIC